MQALQSDQDIQSFASLEFGYSGDRKSANSNTGCV